jgi:hypothetical protein
MPEIMRYRTIRPSTRFESSQKYTVDTKVVTNGDILIVNINHESNPFVKTYRFYGADLIYKDSISFGVKEVGSNIAVKWSGVNPI